MAKIGLRQFFNNFFLGSRSDLDALPESSICAVVDEEKLYVKMNGKNNLLNNKSLSPFIKSLSSYTLPTNYTDFEVSIIGGNFCKNTIFDFQASGNISITNTNVVDSQNAILTVTTGIVEGSYELVSSNSEIASNLVSVNTKNLTFLIPADNTNWVRISSNITTGVGSFLPVSNTTGWDKGASFGTVPANTDFTLEFNIAVNEPNQYGNIMVGVDNSDPDFNHTTIDYCMYVYGTNGGTISIRENGSSKGNFGTCTLSDKLKIKRIGTTIMYYKNDKLLYTSTVPSSTQMVFDVSSYRRYGAENIKLIY